MILIHWAKWRFRRSWFWLSFSWGNGWLNDDQFLSWHDRLHGKKIGPLWFTGISWNGGSPDAGFNMFHLCFAGLVWLGWFPTSAPLVGKLPIWPWLSHDPLPRTDINEGEKLGATKHRRYVRKNGGYSGSQNGLVVYLPKFGISSQHSRVPTRITQAFNVWVYQMSDFKARMLATGCRSIRWLLKHQ
jgi:hypothetical protein